MTVSLLLALALQAAPAAAPPPPSPAAPDTAAAARRWIDDHSRPLSGGAPPSGFTDRVKGAFSRSQSLQGPLDGTWLLKDADGSTLYRVQIADPGYRGGRLEGAWSDDQQAIATPVSSGFFSAVKREGDSVVLQFSPPGAGLLVATLSAGGGGGLSGELRSIQIGEAETRHVTLVRP